MSRKLLRTSFWRRGTWGLNHTREEGVDIEGSAENEETWDSNVNQGTRLKVKTRFKDVCMLSWRVWL